MNCEITYILHLLMTTVYEKYVCTASTLKKTLERYGVAIIPSVLSESECREMVTGMWDTLEHITQAFTVPISRDDPATWRSFYELYPLHSMLLQHWQIGHAQYIWNLRQNPKILAIWSKFWGVTPEELLVSFDGASYHLPPETTKRGWFARSKWLHTDQSYTRNGFECVQSWITGLDVCDGDGTLVVMEGSHKYHGECSKKFEITDKSNWYKITDEKYQFYLDKGCSEIAIKCPKGSAVFWDSRTIHSGREPLKTRTKPNFRCIVYLCYTPRSFATSKDLKKKIKYFEEQRMTSHWPHKIKVFAKYPRTYGNPLPTVKPLPAPKLRMIGKILAGYGPGC